MNRACFIQYPRTIEDLCKPHFRKQRKPFLIEKYITLKKIDYENFIMDLRVEREYIAKNAYLMKTGEKGIWHCVFVRQKHAKYGILVMSDRTDYPVWAAYLSERDWLNCQ